MNSPLNDFFKDERGRVFTPDPFFAKRVMTQHRQVAAREYGIWDFVPISTRPVLALALMLILGFTALRFFVPQPPQRGFLEAYLEGEQAPGESLLYSEAELPDGQQLFVEMMGLGE